MNIELQHRALMEWMGWKLCPVFNKWHNLNGEMCPPPKLTLDLLHEAVKKMNEDQRHTYAVLMAMQFWPMGWNDWQSTLAVSEATITERLKPILEAVGLWREE